MWKSIILIIIILLILLILRARIKNSRIGNEGDIWEEAKNVSRGACAKIKKLLYGC